MGSVKEIEDAISKLPAPDLAELREWFAEFDAASWERRIEDDIAAGRLYAFAEEALRDLREGRCTDL